MAFLEKNKNHPENDLLKEKLKETSSIQIDKLAHSIAKEETAKINCLDCGRCCKSLQPPFTQDDIKRIEDKEDLDPNFRIDTILINDPKNNVKYLKASPCHFLSGTACNIYTNRPAACADFPHLHHDHFKFRINSILKNYEVCPIVYHTIEHLKVALEVC